MIYYVLVLIVVSVISVVTAVYQWRRPYPREKTGALIILASVVWAMGLALEIGSVDLSTKILWSNIQFIGMVVVPTGWLVYTFQYIGRENWVTLRNLTLLSVVPLIILVMVFSNESHSLIYSHISMNAVAPYMPLDKTYGFGFWGFLWYMYTLLIFASLISIQMLVYSRRLYRRQVTALLITTAVPWMSSAIFYFDLMLLPFNMTPLACAIVSVLLAWINPSRLHLEDIMPVAREVVLDGMSDGVFVLDEQSRIVDMNTAAQKLTGWTAKDALGQPVKRVLTFWPDPSKSPLGEGDAGEVIALGNRIYDMCVSPLFDWRRRLNCQVIVLRDVTERKRMDELRRYSEHLEGLVEERTRRLKEAERLATIGELAAMVGHDLRNPLTSIYGAVYYLKTKGLVVDEKARDMLEIIEKDIDYSNKIVNDLLDYSRKIQLDLEETTLRAIVREALSLVKVPENITIVDKTWNETWIRVDKEKMKRTFINIIKNAVDAMPDVGELTIESREADGNLQICFTDTGAGIPEEVMGNIWKPLFTTKARGMGFGLAICKRMVEAHGGSISIKSTVGKGTTIAITLPVTAELKNKR